MPKLVDAKVNGNISDNCCIIQTAISVGKKECVCTTFLQLLHTTDITDTPNDIFLILIISFVYRLTD